MFMLNVFLKIRSVNRAMRTETALLPRFSTTFVPQMTIPGTFCWIPSTAFRALKPCHFTGVRFLWQTVLGFLETTWYFFAARFVLAGGCQQFVVAIVKSCNGRFVEKVFRIFIFVIFVVSVILEVIVIESVQVPTDTAVQPIWKKKLKF